MKNQREINRIKWNKDVKPRVGDNLYLRVRKTSITYLYRKTVNSFTQYISIGKHPVISLKVAKSRVEILEGQAVSALTMNERIAPLAYEQVYFENLKSV